MKFWLLLFLFETDGTFIGKREIQFVNKQECVVAAGLAAQSLNNKPIALTTFCVSDNHYNGVSQDPGVPLDF